MKNIIITSLLLTSVLTFSQEKNDSIKKGNIILYQAEKSIDEAKLKAWLERKFGSKDLTIIKK